MLGDVSGPLDGSSSHAFYGICLVCLVLPCPSPLESMGGLPSIRERLSFLGLSLGHTCVHGQDLCLSYDVPSLLHAALALSNGLAQRDGGPHFIYPSVYPFRLSFLIISVCFAKRTPRALPSKRHVTGTRTILPTRTWRGRSRPSEGCPLPGNLANPRPFSRPFGIFTSKKATG